MKTLLLFSILFLATGVEQAGAQDLSGTWEGSAGSGSNYLRMVLVKTGSGYTGYTYDTDVNGGFCRADFTATYNARGNAFKGSSVRLTENSGTHHGCRYALSFSTFDGTDWLTGKQRALGIKSFLANMGMNYADAFLKRTSRSVDTSTAFMKAAMAASDRRDENSVAVNPNYADVKSYPDSATIASNTQKTLIKLKSERGSDIVQEIATKALEINIRVFDNGLEDGDTVSILYNDRVLADRRLVSVKGFEITIPLDSRFKIHEITLIANNLGSIAPNTATIVIVAGAERYRLNASTDLQRNAVIRIHSSD